MNPWRKVNVLAEIELGTLLSFATIKVMIWSTQLHLSMMIFLKVMLDQWLVRKEKIYRPSLTIYKRVFLFWVWNSFLILWLVVRRSRWSTGRVLGHYPLVSPVWCPSTPALADTRSLFARLSGYPKGYDFQWWKYKLVQPLWWEV